MLQHPLTARKIAGRSRHSDSRTDEGFASHYTDEEPGFLLDKPEERAKERIDPFTESYRGALDIGQHDVLLLKNVSCDTVSNPDKEMNYYDFIHRLADGTFVARYLILHAVDYERPVQSFRLYWKYDGNNRKLLQADLS